MSHTNSLAEVGARRLAKKIENYWQTRGYAGIKTKIVDHVADHGFLQPGERRTIYYVAATSARSASLRVRRAHVR